MSTTTLYPCFEKLAELMERYRFEVPVDGETWDKASEKIVAFLNWVEEELKEKNLHG